MANKLVINNGCLLTPMRQVEKGTVVIEDGLIKAVGAAGEVEIPPAGPEVTVIDAGGRYVAPGFIEGHVHGGGGGDVMDGQVASILTCGRRHAQGGVTAFLPTTLTAPQADIYKALEACEEAMETEYDGASVLGAHLEGPYFAASQAGAQNPAYLRHPEADDYLPLLERFPIIKKVTAAPELPGAMELGRELRRRRIVAAIGHTAGTYQDVVKAVENGYTHATHMFSAMSTIRREKAYRLAGVIEAVLELDELTTEIIADGHHLPPSLINLTLKAKSRERVCLTTDAMAAAGLGPGRYSLFGLDVIVEDDIPSEFEVRTRTGQPVAKLADRTAFASSVATMDQVVRTMVELVGLPLIEAVKMATMVPAAIHGWAAERGQLSPGLVGDVVILDQEVKVHYTIVRGRVVYKR